VSFLLKDIHAHDVGDAGGPGGRGVARRPSLHATLMHRLGVESTARASFLFLQHQKLKWIGLVEVVKEIQKFFGQ